MSARYAAAAAGPTAALSANRRVRLLPVLRRPRQARRKYGVPYPNLYAVPGINLYYGPNDGERARLLGKAAGGSGAEPTGAISADDAYYFNCVQRGHQNLHERLPLMLTMIFMSAFSFPIIGGVAGLVFLVGRVLYFWGYSQAPGKRYYGFVEWLGIFSLLGITVAFAANLFKNAGPY